MKHFVFIRCAVFVMLIMPITAMAQLTIQYDTPINKEQSAVQSILNQSDEIKKIDWLFNQKIRLKTPVTLAFSNIDDANESPYYDSQTKTVTMPYRFWIYAYNIFKDNEYGADMDERERLALDTFIHTILHEMGHALVDTLDLPITGKEEDAVDEFASIMAMNHFSDGGEITLSAAELFYLESFETNIIADEDMAGEHSLDTQRFYALACLAYGNNPNENVNFMDDIGMDANRLDICIEDTTRRKRAWNQILKPHKKFR